MHISTRNHMCVAAQATTGMRARKATCAVTRRVAGRPKTTRRVMRNGHSRPVILRSAVGAASPPVFKLVGGAEELILARVLFVGVSFRRPCGLRWGDTSRTDSGCMGVVWRRWTAPVTGPWAFCNRTEQAYQRHVGHAPRGGLGKYSRGNSARQADSSAVTRVCCAKACAKF